MAGTASQVVTIIADDLTGACDTGCLFAGAGPVGVIAEPDLASTDRHVITVDTESRALSPDAAGAAVRARADRLRPRLATGHVFKKIDSTMRGSVGPELAALLEQGFSGALVCPAFPAQCRVVRHGRLLVDSVPVHESPIGRDPAFHAASSDMTGLLAGVRPVVLLGLDDVRAGREKVAHLLDLHRGAVVAADAETDADLVGLAEAALAVPRTLVAGSAGLGRAVSRALGGGVPVVPLPHGHAWLVVVGSLHPTSRAYVEGAALSVPVVVAGSQSHTDPAPAIAALAGGRPAVVASVTTLVSREDILRSLAETVVAILDGAAPDLLAVTGGDTAYALIRALRPRRFDLVGAPADGLALGRLALRNGREISLLTKAGGFRSTVFDALLGGTP
jgi:D-threonate/D-erythronate kinase